MSGTWIIIAPGGLFAGFVPRSAVIIIWTDSGAGNGDDGDCGGGD
jgi:hypothetical protein